MKKDCSICRARESIHLTWKEVLGKYMDSQEFLCLLKQLHSISFYPKPENIFRCLTYFEYAHTKVVVLGQDPYHGPGQAMGLAFSVPPGERVPPSLANIKKEVFTSTECFSQCKDGSLIPWAEQGVLLLNTSLTVQPGSAGSHAKLGWNTLTDLIIKEVSRKKGVVFMLWGRNAQEKKKLIDEKCNLVLQAAHPSPLSAHRGFFGCNHFRIANEYLIRKNEKPIVW